jgi:hypothetical protein
MILRISALYYIIVNSIHPIYPATFDDLTGEGDLLAIDIEHPVLMKHIVINYVIVGQTPPI